MRGYSRRAVASIQNYEPNGKVGLRLVGAWDAESQSEAKPCNHDPCLRGRRNPLMSPSFGTHDDYPGVQGRLMYAGQRI